MKQKIKIAISGELTLNRLAEYKKSLEKIIESEVEIILDLNNTEKIDAAGFQFLLSFFKTRQIKGKRTSFYYADNHYITDIFRLTGLENVLS